MLAVEFRKSAAGMLRRLHGVDRRMLPALFLAFLVVLTTLLAAPCARYLSPRAAAGVLAGLTVWFIYVGLLGYFGVIKNRTMRPPGIAFIFIPVLVFLCFFVVRLAASPGIALAFPLWLLLGMQSFRIVVELFLHQLWKDGLIPRMLTFAGANVDIYIGASAPLIAWLSARVRGRLPLILTWNVLGLLALANVVILRRADRPRPTQFDPCRSSESHDRHIPLHVHSRIFCPPGRGSSRPCHAGDRLTKKYPAAAACEALPNPLAASLARRGRLRMQYSID